MYDYQRKPDPKVMARLGRIEWILEQLCELQGMSREYLEDEWAHYQKVQAYERSKKALIAQRDR